MGSDGGDILDDSRILPCLELEVVAFGMTLVAHLGHHLRMTFRHLHHELTLKECAAHRLFKIYVLPVGHCEHGDREVHMVGHRGADSIEIAGCLVKHIAEVAETLCVGIHVHHLLCVVCSHVDITKHGNIYHTGPCKLVDVLLSTVAYADIGDSHLIVFGDFRLASRCGGGKCVAYPSERHGHCRSPHSL